MSGDIRIRDSTEADMGAVQAIYAHYVLDTACSFEEEPPDANEMRRRRADLMAKGLPYLVAEVEGQIAAFAYASPFRPRSAYRYTIEDSIYVVPGALGKGVGRKLLRSLIVRCVALGYRQMIAVIGDSENEASIALHESLGFKKEGMLKGVGYKFGRWYDLVIMHLTLRGPEDPPPGA